VAADNRRSNRNRRGEDTAWPYTERREVPLDWQTPASVDGAPPIQRRSGVDRRASVDRRTDAVPSVPSEPRYRAMVFPGQGAQAVGMGRDLAAAFPEAQHVFEEVDDALDERLSRLIAEGPNRN